MSLAALIRKRESGEVATATSAISAIPTANAAGTVARIATVAVASSTRPEVAPLPDPALEARRQRVLEHLAANEAELRRLVRKAGEYYAFTDTEHDLALEIALSDAVGALTCFRTIAEERGLASDALT